jgi:competence protein ComEC
MLSLAASFCVGAWFLQQQATLPSVLWCYALLPLAGVLAVSRRGATTSRGWRRPLSMACACAIGFLWAALLAHLRLAQSLPLDWEGRDVAVTGVIAELPQPSERGLRFRFDLEHTHTPLAVLPSTLALTWYRSEAAALPELHPGQRWRLTLRLRRPHGTSNPAGFDSELWMLERGIRAVGYVRDAPAAALLDASVARPAYWIERMRERVRARILDALPGHPAAGVLVALAIGDQQAIDAAQWTVFTRTGVNHLTSISGLHITMVAGLAFAAVSMLWRRSPRLAARLPAQQAAALAGLAVAFGYALLSGFGVPAQRTVYMLAALALASLAGIRASAMDVLAAALVLVVLLDPWAVLSAGFWLSFGAVALILYVSLGRIGRSGWLVTWVRVQWAITLGLIPILLALFQQVSVISPLANAVAIPLVSLGVVPMTLLGTVLPVDWLLAGAAWLMDACNRLLAYLGSLPAAVWEQHAPPAWATVAAGAGVLLLLAPRGVPARWLGLAAMLPLFTLAPATPRTGELWLDVLDVGQGHAAVLRTAGHALVFDAGPRYSSDSDSGSRVVVPMLRAAGVAAVDGVVISHNDADHSGGLLSVLQAVPADWVVTSLPADEPALALAAAVRRCVRGQTWEWDRVRFTLLHPSEQSYALPGIRDNDRSCVLYVQAPGGSVLLTADIERGAEQQLLGTLPPEFKTDVLIVPHHGSATSSTDALVARLRPAHAVIPVGYRNRFGHPAPDVLVRYERAGAKVWRTDRDGALLVRIRQTVSVQAWRALHPRYWHSQ